MRRDRGKATHIVSLKQLKNELQDFTERFLHDKFNWTTVEEWITSILKERVEDIVMGALGYEWDSWHGREQWKISDCDHGKDKGVLAVIAKMAVHIAEEHIPKLIEARKQKFVEKMLSPASVRQIFERFEYKLDSKFAEAMEQWAEDQASLVVEDVFKQHGDKFLEEIKLKRKLTFQSFEILAEDD